MHRTLTDIHLSITHLHLPSVNQTLTVIHLSITHNAQDTYRHTPVNHTPPSAICQSNLTCQWTHPPVNHTHLPVNHRHHNVPLLTYYCEIKQNRQYTTVRTTGTALPENNEASTNGGTFTSSSARLSSQSCYSTLDQWLTCFNVIDYWDWPSSK